MSHDCIPGCHADEHVNPTSNPIEGSSSTNCWILMQSNDGSNPLFFNRTWSSYREGFGDASGNFWIGNKHLHQMTQLLNQGLQYLPSVVIRNKHKPVSGFR